jgi:hypothetical protein
MSCNRKLKGLTFRNINPETADDSQANAFLLNVPELA